MVRLAIWSVSPEANPDRLKVYCSNKKNNVKFKTDVDSISFSVADKDTFRFYILKGGEKAFTEIIGIKRYSKYY